MDNAGNVEIPGAGISVTIDNTPPTILVAGWWDTYVSYGTGGTITFLALSQDSDIANVQIYYNRIPVSFYLVDDGSQGDWAAGDGIYMFSSPIGPGVTPGTFLLELVATDHAGNHSMMWPYLEFYETDIYAPPATAKHSWVQALRHSIASAARADAFSPQVMVGGFWDTRISTESGGDFLFLAYVLDPQGPSDMQSVELHYLGTPTGVLLLDNGTQGDWSANDQVYSIGTPIGPGYPADSYLFEIVATDIGGHQSMRYPYFEAFN